MKTTATTTTKAADLPRCATAVDRMRGRGLVAGSGRGLHLTLHGQAHAAARAARLRELASVPIRTS